MRLCDGTNWKAQKVAFSANASLFIFHFIYVLLVSVERETETTTINISSYYPNYRQHAHGHSSRECSPKGKSSCKFVSHSAGNICWSKGWSQRSHGRKGDVTVSDTRLPRRGQSCIFCTGDSVVVGHIFSDNFVLLLQIPSVHFPGYYKKKNSLVC